MRQPNGSALLPIVAPDGRPASELPHRARLPVVVEFILEQVTNIAMGTEIDNIVEFEETIDLPLDEIPCGRELLLPV